MHDEAVIDASVLAAAIFEEKDSLAARTCLSDLHLRIAPELLAFEMASIAAKKVWKGLATPEVGARAVETVPTLVDFVGSSVSLAPQAFALAQAHRFSAYDATYLALAERHGLTVITLDKRLANQARQEGLSALITYIGSD